MEMLMWAAVGGMVGWITYSFLGLNEGRGIVVSVIIGAAGGVLGGQTLAPMFTATSLAQGELSTSTLWFAAGVAAALLAAGSLLHKRWGI